MSRPFSLGIALETDKNKLKKHVEELQATASLERTLVSDSLKEMMKYVAEHEQDDHLLHCISGNTANINKHNPFAEKKKCVIL